MKKEYIASEIEVIKLDFGDVITTSVEGPNEPGIAPGSPFDGGYDPNGWT